MLSEVGVGGVQCHLLLGHLSLFRSLLKCFELGLEILDLLFLSPSVVCEVVALIHQLFLIVYPIAVLVVLPLLEVKVTS